MLCQVEEKTVVLLVFYCFLEELFLDFVELYRRGRDHEEHILLFGNFVLKNSSG